MATAEQQVYQALTAAGFSQVQAAGVMGNMENESDFNVEAAALDSNGLESYGLIQWNAGSYPNAGSLVTGNAAQDLANQVQFLLHDTSGTGQGLQGSTASQVASNWAQFVEVCSGCQPGGGQSIERQNNANAILSQIQSGNWGAGGAGITGTGATNASTTGAVTTGIDLPFPFDVPSILGGLLGSNSPAGSLTTGIGEGIASGAISAFTSITNAFLEKLGINGWKDFFARLGLIILGAIILIVGLKNLTKTSNNTTVSLSLPESSGREDESESAEETSGQSTVRSESGNSARNGAPNRQKSTQANSGKTGKSAPHSSESSTGVSSATSKLKVGELADAAVAA
jgi:hypothetical protein